MPFSFIEIEEQKSRVIGYLFVFIFIFYFITAYLVLLVLENAVFPNFSDIGLSGFKFPPADHVAIVLGISFIAGLLHWSMSTSHLIERVSLAVGAVPVDGQDAYHQVLQNIVDEVSVAIGGRPLEARVIPSASLNAFAIEDFNRRAVIGVTEGLLARLNRAQIEAVVGHEAGHITSGDCLSTTVTCALAEIYDESLSRLGGVLKRTRGRGVGALVFIYAIVGLMRFMSNLIRYFVSRQREYRADAIAVRLTRDPLSLAEALKLISSHWRGAGTQGDKMASIFIVNPQMTAWDERAGFFADWFSTHPPIHQRIGILADMAHLDEKALEANLKNFRRVAPIAGAEIKVEQATASSKWFLFKDQAWLGPFFLDELKKTEGFNPEAWVRGEGQTVVKHVYEEEALINLFKEGKPDTGLNCPHCKTPLAHVLYEGARIFKCSSCEGAFVERDKISRILVRGDKEFSEETLRMARTIERSKDKYGALKKIDPQSAWALNCPKCHQKMHREFFVYAYPVEIDNCGSCACVWFDKQELELLQCLYEHKGETS
jgi:heat shock protein HtpX